MPIESCIPVIPCVDVESGLRFWVDGLGLRMNQAIRHDGKLVGCMVGNERVRFWLNRCADAPRSPDGGAGIRLYWAPDDLPALRERLNALGYTVSNVTERDYGQTEFFVTDDDGHSHCFGVATRRA